MVHILVSGVAQQAPDGVDGRVGLGLRYAAFAADDQPEKEIYALANEMANATGGPGFGHVQPERAASKVHDPDPHADLHAIPYHRDPSDSRMKNRETTRPESR